MPDANGNVRGISVPRVWCKRCKLVACSCRGRVAVESLSTTAGVHDQP